MRLKVEFPHMRCPTCGLDWPESGTKLFGVEIEGTGHMVDGRWCPGPIERVT